MTARTERDRSTQTSPTAQARMITKSCRIWPVAPRQRERGRSKRHPTHSSWRRWIAAERSIGFT